MGADERSRLIGAAWTVLERSGYAGFKVQLVLRETGLSARTFYRHFADKDELLLALMTDEYARVGRRIDAALSRLESPDERVVAWVREIVTAAGDPARAGRARLFTAQPAVLRRFPDRIAAAARAILDPLTEAVTAGRNAGIFPLGDPARDPALIQQLAGAVMSDALDRGDTGSADDLAASVAAFVLRALGATVSPRDATDPVVRQAAGSRGGTAPRTPRA
jgi:AcrR family transcriptional regulator